MDFVDFLYRIKQELDFKQDKDVAQFLGLDTKAFSARKTRNSIPEKHLLAALAKQPELNVDVDYILTGKRKNVDKSTNIALVETPSLTQEETLLLAQFRQLNEEGKTAIFSMLSALLPKKAAEDNQVQRHYGT
ncbi:helix-turn-helix domain-containing protein [Kingella kingae]|uniref:helix-turn-helix domain-containing protein n=1 Tax=Kingella kingae TaxID=504 RepID=UPI00254C26F2|nr:helix-turn-helix domain-containing protein [Kingella kingae]MDK4544751.1 helix-turn-helix domain-containing protein [Kingella kingae]MDK4566833.1 helix-turn-helix domain-containing protein [Kingella kingae]MDK4577149.1 helix-turn-helix domain-containing protein [Kingella kingae]MDK4583162.1 helix-turn-helix domain-containing protein [Kingella kingae]MDK4590801.1 helix-turn-helix domain-containing protein [Kingella kingae]